jgi:hypothetical protein
VKELTGVAIAGSWEGTVGTVIPARSKKPACYSKRTGKSRQRR